MWELIQGLPSLPPPLQRNYGDAMCKYCANYRMERNRHKLCNMQMSTESWSRMRITLMEEPGHPRPRMLMQQPEVYGTSRSEDLISSGPRTA